MDDNKEVTRTIPTGVGKTASSAAVYALHSDHPHGRGENWTVPVVPFQICGPSPRAWGKPSTVPLGGVNVRTIPTGVGKTLLVSHRHSSISDHPHGRGENKSSKDFDCGVHGPSPRAWGKLRIHHQLRPIRRTIPTGVGKTSARARMLDIFTDHPHGRGENNSPGKRRHCRNGPSPRAWGKRIINCRRLQKSGPSPRAWGKRI